MSLLSKKLRSVAMSRGKGVSFWCPGCEGTHAVPIEGPHSWTLSGTLDAPTLNPSLDTTSGHHVPGWTGPECWCTYNKKHTPKAPFECVKCHLILTEGYINFLGDSTHKLANQNRIPLPDLPTYLQEEIE